MVQSYLKALSKPDAVITTTSANATVNALIKSNPGFAGDIDIICFVVELVYLGIIYLVYLVYSWSKIDTSDGGREEMSFCVTTT